MTRTDQTPPPVVPFTEMCLALFAFRGFLAGLLLVSAVWAMVTWVYVPPWWLTAASTPVVLGAAAWVCTRSVARHRTSSEHRELRPGAGPACTP